MYLDSITYWSGELKPFRYIIFGPFVTVLFLKTMKKYQILDILVCKGHNFYTIHQYNLLTPYVFKCVNEPFLLTYMYKDIKLRYLFRLYLKELNKTNFFWLYTKIEKS